MSDARIRNAYRNYQAEPSEANKQALIREIGRAGLTDDTYSFGVFIVEDELVDDESVKGLLCSGMEGGIGYWASIEGYEIVPGLTYADFQEGGSMQGEQYWWPPEIIPTVPGCAVMIGVSDEDETTHRLDRPSLQRGLVWMKNNYTWHWDAFINQNEDAITGDVFIQACLFGDIVYG